MSLDALIARIARCGDLDDIATPRPLVTLEEFFEGNVDYGSIGYNFYPDQPAPAEFYELFKRIRDRPEVADVRAQVSQHDDPNAWPSSDTIWVITRASPDAVTDWLGPRFVADDIIVGWPTAWRVEPYEIPPGMQAIGVWWD